MPGSFGVSRITYSIDVVLEKARFRSDVCTYEKVARGHSGHLTAVQYSSCSNYEDSNKKELVLLVLALYTRTGLHFMSYVRVPHIHKLFEDIQYQVLYLVPA